MGPRLSIILGLVSGALVASLAIGLVVVALPGLGVAASPLPSLNAPSPVATRSGASPVTSPASPTPSVAASGPAPSANAGRPANGSSPSPTPISGFHVGQPAPALSLARVGGGRIDLASLRGKPVWVNFMQTTCPPCLDELPLMNGFAARYADSGLVIVAVDIREDEGVVAAFAESLNVTFPIALDRDGAAQRAWGAYGLPVHFWVDAGGIVRDGALGGIGPDIMARGLQRILPGVEVTP